MAVPSISGFKVASVGVREILTVAYCRRTGTAARRLRGGRQIRSELTNGNEAMRTARQGGAGDIVVLRRVKCTYLDYRFTSPIECTAGARPETWNSCEGL